MKGLFETVNDPEERAQFLSKFPFTESDKEETEESDDSDASSMLPKD